MALEGGWLAGNGLGGRGLFAGDVGLRYGFFFDRPDWLTRLAVEDEAEALFGDLGHGLDFSASDIDIDEVGRSRQIVVPHPVVGDLEVPDALARSGIQADEALGEEVVARAVPAIVIVSRGAHWQIDITQFGIGAHQGPDVGVAGVFPRAVFPGLVAKGTFLWDGFKDPLLGTSAHVEAAHIAWGHGLVGRATNGKGVEDHCADDGDVAADDRRRGDRVEFAFDWPAQALGQIHAAVVAKALDGLAGIGVESDEIGVAGAKENAPVVAVFPIGDPAVD